MQRATSALHFKLVDNVFFCLFVFYLQMVIPGDAAEMTEFQEKTTNNSRFILELCFPNVQLVLPGKAFYEKLHNR